MQTELIRELNKVLKAFPQFWNGEELHRTIVVDAISRKQPDLIKALVANEKIKSVYGTDIDGIFIFDFDNLCKLLKYKEYWSNSFTKYRNKVGLTSEGKYLDYSSDVVLDFPFKDCVLEGAMTKEDQGKDEIYYNEIIARDEIDRLFSPKVFTNTKRYTKNGVTVNIESYNNDDNLIIKGNNLIALHSLKERYAGKIKLIYIDPPYNTDSDGFKYNDRFNRSTWLTFMKSRIEISRDLLSNDGILFIQCDDNEQSYLKCLLDSIFGEDNLMANIVVKMSEPSGVKMTHADKRLPKLKEYILSYKKNNNTKINALKIPKKTWDNEYNTIMLGVTPDELSQIELISNSEYVSDADISIISKITSKMHFETLSTYFKKENVSLKEQDKFKYDNAYRIFQTTATSESFTETLKSYIYKNNISNDVFHYVTPKGKIYLIKNKIDEKNKKPRVQILFAKNFLETNPGDFWADIKTTSLDNEGTVIFKNGKKPEELIRRILHIGTNKGDLVLDFHLGSGTTAAVAHKMGRRYIGIEQMDYINEITVPRLQKVIEGEQGGISKDVNWQGGGSFVYAELMELNAYFVHEIQKAQSSEELEKLFAVMKTEAHLNYQVALENVLSAEYEMDGIPRKVAFSELELHEQKQLLIEILDKNQLYVNASEMGDSDLNISESDKAFTHSFYGME
ncbi:DNA methyltransferase [Providencia rettgeri]